MKKIFLFLTLVIAVTLSVNAQGKRDKKHTEMMEKMSTELNLSEIQKEQMKSLHRDMQSKMEELKKDNSLSKEARQTRKDQVQEQHRMSVEQMLTPEQQTKWREMWKDKKNMRKKVTSLSQFRGDSISFNRHNMKNAPAVKWNHSRGGRNLISTDKLDLTDQQKEQIEQIQNEYSYRSEQLRKEYREQAESLLTPDQKSKLQNDNVTYLPDPRGDARRNQMRLDNITLSEEAKAKIKELEETFETQRETIQKSGMDPDMVRKQVNELRENYRKERRKVMMEGIKQ